MCVGVNERKEDIHRLLTCTKAKYGCVYYMTNPQFCVAMLYSMFCQVVFVCVCMCVLELVRIKDVLFCLSSSW